MEYIQYVTYFLIMIGVSWSSYRIGNREGGEKMIDMLERVGIIIVDQNDNVQPNKMYDPDYQVKK